MRADFKTPVLLVTHDLDECFELGEEMLVLREGRIVQSGAPRPDSGSARQRSTSRGCWEPSIFSPREIRTLDPGRNTSRVQFGEFEMDGPYFPGRLKGDRVTICVRPEQLTALPRNGRPGPNQIPAVLSRVIEKPQGVRLEFAAGIAVDISRADYERQRQNREWLIEFPAASLRAL